MDMHKIEVFIVVAQHRSFTAAAQYLHIAQSAVSHDIAELEKTLGAKLFERTRVGVALSPAGEVFLSDAYKMVAIAESTRYKIEKLASGEGGELDIGFVSEQMAEPIVPFLQAFCGEHRSIRFTFNAFSSPEISRKLELGTLDIGLDRRETLRADDVQWTRLYRDPYCVVVREDHPLAKARRVTLETIADEPILLMTREANPGFYDMVQKFFTRSGFAPRIAITSNDRMATIMMVRLGMGVTVLTKQFVKVYDFGGVVVKPFAEEDAFHEIGVGWNRRVASPVARLFLDALEEYRRGFPDGMIPIK